MKQRRHEVRFLERVGSFLSYIAADMAKCTTFCMVYHAPRRRNIFQRRSLAVHPRGIRTSERTFVILQEEKEEKEERGEQR
jgi:hypothetical protein